MLLLLLVLRRGGGGLWLVVLVLLAGMRGGLSGRLLLIPTHKLMRRHLAGAFLLDFPGKGSDGDTRVKCGRDVMRWCGRRGGGKG
jgi:hypothetical protein